MSLALTDRVAVRPDVIFRPLGAEAIVLDLEGGSYFGLDEIGARIWALIETQDLEGASRALAEEYDVSIGDARRDVVGFAQTLIDRGLLSRVAADAV
jgi:hypothetical protein